MKVCQCISSFRHGTVFHLSISFVCLGEPSCQPGAAIDASYYDRRYGTGIWTIPVSLALGLLNRADAAGMLDEQYDDLHIERHCGTNNCIIDSRNLDRPEREREFASIINVNRDPDWGLEPLFVIIQVPDRRWRKIMMVDTLRGICIFRSTTTDTSYRQGVVDGMILPWRLDNTMQDASRTMIREFQRVLRAL